MKRIDVVLKMRETGVVPLFYHPDEKICREVISACYRGGMKIFEFTNRGEFAHETFGSLARWSRENLPDLVLGVGTVVDSGTCSLYIQMGAKFIVSPLLNEDMAKTCNRRKVLWIPGCATASEIGRAEELGAEVVKLFPGPTVGGPAFLKAYLGPCPWSFIMPSGGVTPDEENLSEWFGAGAFCVGMGSQLISREILAARDYGRLEEISRKAIGIIEKIRK
ncbi:MAG: bifunctional 4-hydroxy-2-oxoglutarate aldolase/2-dehydro-3-deoxy-phosphogluconate aldolase [Bacteroidetes bacterium]|nr:MAG: bifunctional 4-hydroxy-2-oxoglutarate aldolase/2-dehydro-3-deoxy-phosphogluconate aldolase [Bacteroidota bacterium]